MKQEFVCLLKMRKGRKHTGGMPCSLPKRPGNRQRERPPHTFLTTDSIDLADQEACSFPRIWTVAEMRSENSTCQVAKTNCVRVGKATEDLELVTGKVGNLLVVRACLCIAESNNACNLILDSSRKVFNCAVVNSCTLRIASTNDDRLGALAIDILQNVAHGKLRDKIGSTREVVRGQERGVVDALNSQV